MKENKHNQWSSPLFQVSGFFFLVVLLSYSQLQAQNIEQLRANIDTGFNQGEYERIIPLIYQLRPRYKAVKDSVGYAETFSYIVSCHYHSGNLEIKPYTDSAFQVGKQYQIASTSNFYGTMWSLQGNYYKNRAAYKEALVAFEELLRIDTTLLGLDPEHPEWYVGSAYQNIGTIYTDMGDHQQAIAYYQYALPYLENMPQELINTYINIGFSYKQLGNSEQSKNYYQQVSKLTQTSKQRVRESLLLDVETNLYESDETQLRSLYTRIPSDDLVRLARNHQLRANIYIQQKNFKLAKEFSQKALQIRQQEYGNKHPSIAISYKRLGNISDSLKQPELALQYYQKALTALIWDFNDSLDIHSNPILQQQISSKPQLLEILTSKAKTASIANYPRLALATFDLVVDLIDDLRINYIANHSIYWLLANTNETYEAGIKLALELGETEKAFEFIARSKSVLLLESVRDLQAKHATQIPDSLLQQEREFKINIAYYERELFEAKRKEEEHKASLLQELRFKTKQTYLAFLNDLEQKYPNYYVLKYQTAIASVSDLKTQLIDKKSVLVEFFVGTKDSYAAVISKDDFKIHSLSTPPDLEQQIIRFRSNLATPYSQEDVFQGFANSAYSLYKHYWEAIQYDLPKNIERLIVIPDKQLGYIPFQALIQYPLTDQYKEARYDTLSYLMKHYRFSYAYASSLLLENTNRRCNAPKANYGGFAPNFDGSPSLERDGEKLGNLIATQQEVLEIDSIVNGRLYLGDAATKTAFLEHSDKYKILHLATHANMDDYDPMQSKIYFMDDYLTTREIYNLPICAELAVLSACETGTGKLKKGEGIMSLARAFAQAGCPSLVSSLWKVNDRQTSRIMIDFYKNLYAGKPKDEALHLAQTTYFDKIYSYSEAHPYYWASFVLIGESRPIFHSNFAWHWGMGLIFLLLLLLVLNLKR